MFTLEVSTGYGAPEDIVGPLRDAAKDRPAGLELDVTGPGAIDGDMDTVFDGIDVQVLLTTIVVVTLLLILTYRSPVLWIIPLVAVGAAALTAMATVYLLVKGFGIVVNDQNSALLTILVFGVGTDYALLLIARYREALHHHEKTRSPRCNGERGGTDEIRDGDPGPSRIFFMGPTVAALWSCATRRGWGRRIAVSCPDGEPRGAMPEGRRPLSCAAPPGRVSARRCPPRR